MINSLKTNSPHHLYASTDNLYSIKAFGKQNIQIILHLANDLTSKLYRSCGNFRWFGILNNSHQTQLWFSFATCFLSLSLSTSYQPKAHLPNRNNWLTKFSTSQHSTCLHNVNMCEWVSECVLVCNKLPLLSICLIIN